MTPIGRTRRHAAAIVGSGKTRAGLSHGGTPRLQGRELSQRLQEGERHAQTSSSLAPTVCRARLSPGAP
jgi:hypothetical protein